MSRSISVSLMAVMLTFFAMLIMFSGPAEAEMVNNLSNEGCNRCHINYPSVKLWGSEYAVKHKFDVCDDCHTTAVSENMWNCRYCHLTVYNGLSGFKSYRGPLLGYPLGTGEFMDDHGTRSIDANWTTHSSNMPIKHASGFPSGDCVSCHKNTLTLEHDGKQVEVKGIMEDFEDATFSLALTGDWIRVTTTPKTGTYCYKSKTITHRQSTSTQASVYLNEVGEVSFWYKVSSEPGYDFFRFYIDGVEKLTKSGSGTWVKASFPLAAGSHTLKWTYSKDGSASYYQDSAYIDDVTVSGMPGATLRTYPMDCNTCHTSTNPDVKAAFTNHSTSCLACHKADHEAKHPTQLDTKCQKCHSETISKEHISNTTTTTGKNYTCDTCHSSSQYQVSRAIRVNNLNCSGCHRLGHGVVLEDKVPSDIPLYEGFQWSNPIEVSIFSSEPKAPAGYDGGQVVFTNRRADIDAAKVWDFYNPRLTAGEWLLKSGSYITGSKYFSAEYEKLGRKVNVRCFNTQFRDGTGDEVGAGYRLEIWYK